jgi:phosphinothricin acetyltransferase
MEKRKRRRAPGEVRFSAMRRESGGAPPQSKTLARPSRRQCFFRPTTWLRRRARSDGRYRDWFMGGKQVRSEYGIFHARLRVPPGILFHEKRFHDQRIPDMKIAECTFEQAPEILAIFNESIANSTALYDYQPRTMANMETWFETKRKGNFPVIGAFDTDGKLTGFASYGTFRAWPAYKYSIEHSVYVRKENRGQGLGKLLLCEIVEAAKKQEYHTIIGVIDAANETSIQLHRRAGFSECAHIQQAGYKFGRWLDVVYYQLMLPTPEHPTDG